MRAYVEKGPDAPVRAPHENKRDTGGLDGAEVEGLRQLAVVADELPDPAKELAFLVGEHAFICINQPTDIVAVGNPRASRPRFGIAGGHAINS